MLSKFDETQQNLSVKKRKEVLEELRGALSEYARPELLDLENGVWERTILNRCVENAFARR